MRLLRCFHSTFISISIQHCQLKQTFNNGSRQPNFVMHFNRSIELMLKPSNNVAVTMLVEVCKILVPVHSLLSFLASKCPHEVKSMGRQNVGNGLNNYTISINISIGKLTFESQEPILS